MVKDPFALFQLPMTFALDHADLKQRYLKLAEAVHPDRFAQGSQVQKTAALRYATEVEDAYRILKDDLQRGHYLLEKAGVDMTTTATMPDSFLQAQFALREQLDEAANNAETLAEFIADTDRHYQNLLTTLTQRLENDAHTSEAKIIWQTLKFWQSMRASALQMQRQYTNNQ